MYLEFFSLHTKPFELLPDPEFLFLSAAHKKALAYLEYGLRELPGFLLVTGEVGAGKTTLIRTILRKTHADITIAKVFNTKVNAEQLVRMILDDFGVEGGCADKAEMLHQLNMFLIEQYAARRHSLLIIDEAQNLAPDVLEEVRLLSNLETDNAKLLHIILVGQPELRERLNSPEFVQLRQRILVHCHVPPLSREEAAEYVLHRLELAGNRDALVWRPGCMEAVHAASRGIPRLINILCDYILLDAFSADRREVTTESLRALLQHLDFEGQFWPESKPVPATRSAGASAARIRPLEDRVDVLYAAVAGLIRRRNRQESSARDGGGAEDLLRRLEAAERRITELEAAREDFSPCSGMSEETRVSGDCAAPD